MTYPAVRVHLALSLRATSLPVSRIGLAVPAPAFASMRFVVPRFTCRSRKLSSGVASGLDVDTAGALDRLEQTEIAARAQRERTNAVWFTVPSSGTLISTVSAVDSSRTLPPGEHVTHGESLCARERDVSSPSSAESVLTPLIPPVPIAHAPAGAARRSIAPPLRVTRSPPRFMSPAALALIALAAKLLPHAWCKLEPLACSASRPPWQ